MERPCRNVEYSVKVDGPQVWWSRMAVIFDRGLAEVLTDLRAGIEVLGAHPGAALDLSLVRAVESDLDLERVTLAAFGLDARPELSDSRLKLWWSIVDQPEKQRELLDLGAADALARALVEQTGVLLTGVDLSLDGRTRLKLYPKIVPEHLDHPELGPLLSRTLPALALSWASRSRRTNVTREPGGGRTLHFQPRAPRELLAQLDSPAVQAVDQRLGAIGLGLNVLSISERSLAGASATPAGPFNPATPISPVGEVNLYYVEES